MKAAGRTLFGMRWRGFRTVGASVFLTAVLVAGCRPAEERMAGRRREWAFEVLGAFIGEAVPDARVLVVGNPFAAGPDADPSLQEGDEAAVRGLRRGLGDRGSVIGLRTPALKAEAQADPRSVAMPPGTTTPLSFLTRPGAWDQLRAEEPMADVWVSLIGVPADLAETRSWKDPNGPRWVLYLPDLRLVGGRDEVLGALRSGRLLAALLRRPGAPPESEPLAATAAQEAERRFVLLTRDSAESILSQWPALMP